MESDSVFKSVRERHDFLLAVEQRISECNTTNSCTCEGFLCAASLSLRRESHHGYPSLKLILTLVAVSHLPLNQ